MLAVVRTRVVEGWSVVVATGELDLASAPAYRQELRAAMQAPGAGRDLVVDLTEVELFDSVSLGLTLGAARRVRERGGRFRVVVATDRVRRTFELTGTGDLVDMVPTLNVAVSG